MPFPVYHFGPNAFIGLLFRRWLDPAVILAASIVVDFEVLFAPGWPPHRHWHLHSWLIGALIGAAFGACLYLVKPAKIAIAWGMNLLRIPYKPNFWKMTVSGALGACMHVVVDGFYHYDVQPLFPGKHNPLWRWLFDITHSNDLSQARVKLICALLFIPAIVLYVLAVREYNKRKSSIESSDVQTK
jgi:hypothetical protein